MRTSITESYRQGKKSSTFEDINLEKIEEVHEDFHQFWIHFKNAWFYFFMVVLKFFT